MGTFLLVFAVCLALGGGGAGIIYKNSLDKSKAASSGLETIEDDSDGSKTALSDFDSLEKGNAVDGLEEELSSEELDGELDEKRAKAEEQKKSISVSNGKIMLDISKEDGSVGIFAINEKGKKEDLLSYSNGYANSYFMLKVDNTQYTLRGSKQINGVKSFVKETKNGAQVFYVIGNVAQVAVDYTFVPNIATIYVTTFITNTGRKAKTFTLKAVYDTFLGESSKSDAFSLTGEALNKRAQITEFRKDDWLLSGNRRVKIAFVPLNTDSLNSLQALTVGNPEDFLQRKWLPKVAEGKMFSSVYAFNDSAFAFNWRDTMLERGESVAQSFVISAGVDGAEPDFVAANGAEPVKKKIEEVSENLVKLSAVELPDSALAELKKIDEEKESQENKKSKAKKEDNTEKTVLEMEYEITDSQLDPVYIQSLLDRIASLKEDGSVDKSEIRRLSDELDAIFLKLRQKNETVND